MKKITLLLILILTTTMLWAQQRVKLDTAYYLLDTARTPLNDRMWNVDEDGPFKIATLKCSCVNNVDHPIFIYKFEESKKVIVKSSEIKKYNLITIPDLIDKYKQTYGFFTKGYVFYFFEPSKNNSYTLHKIVRLDKTRTVN